MKKIISLILVLAFCFSIAVPTYAADETNTLGITFSASLDNATIQKSDADQQVVLTVVASAAVDASSIRYTASVADGLTLANLEGDGTNVTGATTNLTNGKFSWSATGGTAISVTTIAKVTVTVPANTAAGTYDIGVSDIELSKDYGMTIVEEAASATATLTITDAPYTASISTTASNNEVASGDTLTVNVGVTHISDTVFNAGEIKLSYDSTMLNPDTTALDNMVTDGTLSGYRIDSGVLTIEDFGGDKNMPYTYGIPFIAAEVDTDTSTAIALTDAAFIHKDAADESDLIDAAKSPESLTVTIKVAMVDVTLTDKTDPENPVTTQIQKGEDFIFAPTDTANYTYSEVTATVSGQAVEIVDNGDGRFTIAGANVTGDISITYSKAPNTYDVTYSGDGAGDVTGKPESATYGTDFIITLPADKEPGTEPGYTYGISAKIGETEVGSYDSATRTLTISGTAITGDISITVTKETTSATAAIITVDGDSGVAIKDVTGNSATVEIGGSVTLVLNAEAGYIYTVTYGDNQTVTFGSNNEYTFTVTENVTFNVIKTLDVSTVKVSQYVTMDSVGSAWLVTFDGTLAEGKVPAYDGNVMFWSEKYDAYCWLVIADTLTVDAAKEKIDIQTGTAINVDYGMDINGTNVTDAADAQLVWNMYNALYSDFNTVSMARFLAADQNASSTDSTTWKLTVEDAQVIIAAILAGTATI